MPKDAIHIANLLKTCIFSKFIRDYEITSEVILKKANQIRIRLDKIHPESEEYEDYGDYLNEVKWTLMSIHPLMDFTESNSSLIWNNLNINTEIIEDLVKAYLADKNYKN